MSSSAINLSSLEDFILKIENFNSLKQTKQIDYFLYFLTVECKRPSSSASQIKECFLLLRLKPYSNIRAYLIDNLKSTAQSSAKFLKDKYGYLIHRTMEDRLRNSLTNSLPKAKISKSLRSLLDNIQNNNENEFLSEAINCFEISAYRASIVMVWNLTIDHLYEYILINALPQFNNTLSKNTDKRIKVSEVCVKDDFSEIPEGKFIEFCKSANIISNDVRKILDTKLGIRNTYAHPSNVKMTESKAIEFIEDVLNNIVFKFRINGTANMVYSTN